MTSSTLIAIPKDVILNQQDDNVEFFEIHLDEEYDIGEDVTLHRVLQTEDNAIMIQSNYKLFWNPDQCLDFITSCEWRKVFISLTDALSYLLPLIHDIPQIIFIYIYSTSPEAISYTSDDYRKLRAIVNENSPDSNNQLLIDIAMFQRDLLPMNFINPAQRKTKLLVHEPLPVEEYMVIWIDDKDATTDLDTKCITDIINRLDIFFTTQHCIDAIKESSKNTKIFLILSHSNPDAIVKEVAHLSRVIVIYLFDQCEQTAVNLNYSIPKIQGNYSDLESLSNQISHDYKNLTHNSPLSISIFDRKEKQKTVRDLTKESAQFLWLQLLIDILIRTPYSAQSKSDMIIDCRIHHKDNVNALKSIEEFDETYKSNEALKFYTNDSFLYRLFNQALRTENIDFIFIFHFFLNDMYNQLQKLYSEQFLTNPKCVDDKLVVYRGQSMKMTEFDQIKNNVGRLISVGTFFSTTKNFDLAVIFSGSDANNREPELLSVIFEIAVDLTRDAMKRPFASLKDISKFPEEDEILFCVGSTFRIIDVHDRQASDGYWHVKMILVEDDEDINELRNELKKDYSPCGNLCDLGYALIGMCDYDRAERYYRMLLEHLPENDRSVGHIQGSLGVIFANRGDYQTALKFQEQALKFWTTDNPRGLNKNEVGQTYVHIGSAYRHLGQLDLALKYCSMAVDMQSRTGSLAFTYNEIAITHRDKGEHILALEYFLKSLQIEEQVLKQTKYHPKLATAYNNIGEIYSQLGDNENALKYLEQALDMRLKGTSSTHTDLAAVYHNLGVIYGEKHESKKALEMSKKALEIDSQIFPDDHESLAASHNSISTIHCQLGDLMNALYHAEKGLRILLRSQAKDNRSVVAVYQYNLGQIQFQLGNTTKALKMAEKALNNLLASPTENQNTASSIYHLFSLIYEKEGDISKALEYTEKAVEQTKLWGLHNNTSQLGHFLLRLEDLKNKSSREDSKFPESLTRDRNRID